MRLTSCPSIQGGAVEIDMRGNTRRAGTSRLLYTPTLPSRIGPIASHPKLHRGVILLGVTLLHPVTSPVCLVRPAKLYGLAVGHALDVAWTRSPTMATQGGRLGRTAGCDAPRRWTDRGRC
jgi:hypothetical protein